MTTSITFAALPQDLVAEICGYLSGAELARLTRVSQLCNAAVCQLAASMADRWEREGPSPRSSLPWRLITDAWQADTEHRARYINKNIRQLVLIALHCSVDIRRVQYLPRKRLSDPNLDNAFRRVLQDGSNLLRINAGSLPAQGYRDVVLVAVQQDGFLLRYTNDTLKKDREIVLAAVQKNGYNLQYADATLRKDREIALAAVQQAEHALQYADNTLTRDRDFVLAAVQQNGDALRDADDTLKKDREIVLAAVKDWGLALRCADDTLKKDREIVLEAVQNCSSALRYADDTLKKDREIVLAAMTQEHIGVERARRLWYNL